MPGKVHDVGDVKRVLVFVEENDGRTYGYEVHEPTALSWRLTGVGGDGSIARVMVEGRFWRKQRQEIAHVLDDPVRPQLPKATAYVYDEDKGRVIEIEGEFRA